MVSLSLTLALDLPPYAGSRPLVLYPCACHVPPVRCRLQWAESNRTGRTRRSSVREFRCGSVRYTPEPVPSRVRDLDSVAADGRKPSVEPRFKPVRGLRRPQRSCPEPPPPWPATPPTPDHWPPGRVTASPYSPFVLLFGILPRSTYRQHRYSAFFPWRCPSAAVRRRPPTSDVALTINVPCRKFMDMFDPQELRARLTVIQEELDDGVAPCELTGCD